MEILFPWPQAKHCPLRSILCRAAQFTREVLLMELLAAEQSDEEPDDSAMSGSEDKYTL
jgi:hypothetical protein